MCPFGSKSKCIPTFCQSLAMVRMVSTFSPEGHLNTFSCNSVGCVSMGMYMVFLHVCVCRAYMHVCMCVFVCKRDQCMR